VDLKTASILDLLKDIVFNHYQMINEYAAYLELTKEYSPSTICNYFYALVSVCKWLKYFSSSLLADFDLTGFNLVVSAIKKTYLRKQKIKRTDQDITQCIQNRRLPTNGLRSLMECLNAELIWVKSFFDQEFWIELIDKQIYNRLMTILYASLYVFSVQGRKGGIEDLRYQQGKIMLEKGHANSKVFKTRAAFGYQPISLSKKSYLLFKVYFLQLRPIILHNAESSEFDPLWLTWNGSAENKIGSKITNLFKKKLKLKITTTKIRSMVETEAKFLFDQGKISKIDRDSVSNINGHSSRTTESFYLQVDRDSDVKHGRTMFQLIQNDIGLEELSTDEFIETPFDESWTPPQISMPEWGAKHPHYKIRQNMLRAKWSKEEIDYIGNWCTKKLQDNIEIRSIIISLCWKHITNPNENAEAIPIFHEIHVLDSGRLRTGYLLASKTFLILNQSL
jgi:hypothetical protein